MKEQIIQIPDTLEIKEIKDGKIILVEKEKKLTYEGILKELFPNNEIHYYINDAGYICSTQNTRVSYTCPNNGVSRQQLEKLIAINKLMNVAKYLNSDWQPNWNDVNEEKYYIAIEQDKINIEFTRVDYYLDIYFKSMELAKQAIEILGEEIIKLALCTNY